MDLDYILNDALNKALVSFTERIKGTPNSNKIAQFVSDYLKNMPKELVKNCSITDVSSIGYTPPFRVGRKQKRAVLDANGLEFKIFPKGMEKQAQNFCDLLNNL